MGISVRGAYAALCADLGLRFIYRGVEPHHVFDSLYVLSVAAPDDLPARTAHFVDWLERLDDGVHFVMSHPGIESSELPRHLRPGRRQRGVGRAVAAPPTFAALTDPAVRARSSGGDAAR